MGYGTGIFGRFASAGLLILAASACTASWDSWPRQQTASASSEASAAAGGPQTPRDKPAPPGSVAVKRGDTVYAISRRTGVPAADLIQANQLTPPYVLHPGEHLTLPRLRQHTVRRGDTLYGISRRYGTDMRTLAEMNGLSSPYRLRVGMQLDVPATAIRMASAGNAPPATLTPPPRSGDGFMWPLRGTVLSSFGPKEGGLHNDGVNIAATAGAPVRAAEEGLVAYADDGLRGFGNLILIRHAGGWVTAYAHNGELLVSKGDRVRRGQVVARAGESGAVNRPQLHFEMRKGSRAVDPLQYLP